MSCAILAVVPPIQRQNCCDSDVTVLMFFCCVLRVCPTDLPVAVSTLGSLTKLWLTNNSLTNIPAEISTLGQISYDLSSSVFKLPVGLISNCGWPESLINDC